jgi:DNA (cytosine-5)-methyltransferase 1
MAAAELTFFDVFSGIGGFKIGLERAGFKSIGFCDNDKHANALYKAYFQNEIETNEEVFYDDIRTIDTSKLPGFDILCAGFPCQSFSIAGKRKGFQDSRGDLFFELVRVLKDKRPRYFLFENVKGLLNHNDRKTFITIIKTLSNFGYRVQWQLLNSKFFGIPQNRERVYIVGCLGDECIGKIFPAASNSSENPRKLKKHPLSICYSRFNRVYSTDGISSCLMANSGGLGAKTGLYFINNSKFSEYRTSDTVQTLKVGGDKPLAEGRIRKLTPPECFKLQGFPDDMIAAAKTLELKDNQLYKMAGNAVTVNVAEAVAKKLREAIDGK